MLIVPDVEDLYTPLHSEIIVQLAEVGNFTIFSRLCNIDELILPYSALFIK